MSNFYYLLISDTKKPLIYIVGTRDTGDAGGKNDKCGRSIM